MHPLFSGGHDCCSAQLRYMNLFGFWDFFWLPWVHTARDPFVAHEGEQLQNLPSHRFLCAFQTCFFACLYRQLCTGEAGDGKVYRKPLHYKGSAFHRIIPQVRCRMLRLSGMLRYGYPVWYATVTCAPLRVTGMVCYGSVCSSTAIRWYATVTYAPLRSSGMVAAVIRYAPLRLSGMVCYGNVCSCAVIRYRTVVWYEAVQEHATFVVHNCYVTLQLFGFSTVKLHYCWTHRIAVRQDFLPMHRPRLHGAGLLRVFDIYTTVHSWTLFDIRYCILYRVRIIHTRVLHTRTTESTTYSPTVRNTLVFAAVWSMPYHTRAAGRVECSVNQGTLEQLLSVFCGAIG